ncbi:MAG TPA: Uma2 family endonuclease [Candidatus Limnocylindria bacterium]|nr:Uma2 family endonuclease [Candidatus Limnocylindria bacterium]
MGTTTETPLLTFEEFERLPDQPGKCELLNGELVQLPPAELLHNRISHWIYKILDAAVTDAHGRGAASELGEVFHEMGYKLSRNAYLQPDVSITHARQAEGKYLGGAPAIAIEIVSPSNLARHLDRKTDLYFEFGAREVWRIYPDTRRAIIHTGCTDQIRTEREAIATPLLPGFTLSLKEILPA